MKLRKTLAMILALVMVMGLALTAGAEGWSVVCTGLGAVSSEALPASTSPKTWTFTSTTNADAVNNWDTAAINVFSANGWELTIRSDSFAVSNANNWGTAGEDAIGGKAYPADWAAWLEANKAGAPCTVTAQVVAGTETNYIIVGFSNNGVTNVYRVATTAAVDSISVFLTGENCVLTDLASSEAHIDLSAAISSIPSEEPEEEPDEWRVVCTGLGAVSSEALPITTTPKTWTFTSTTNADAVNNWDTAAINVFSANGWELTIRSDSFAVSNANNWGTAGEDAFGGKAYPADWAAWLADNKTGAPCTVTAQVVAGEGTNYIVVGFSNDGVTNIYILPTTAALDSVSVFLTGENCVLTDLASSDAHIDLSAAVASVTPEEPEETEPEETEPEETEPEETEPEETEPEETEPEETEPEETEPEETEPEETEPETTEPEETEPVVDQVVDCPAWWGGHTAPVQVTEELQSWTFVSTSYETALDNWDSATVVVWRSDDGTMSGANYMEELLVRSDSFAVSEEYFWGTAGQNSFNAKNYPADWAEWLAANKAGAVCTVTAQIVNGYIIVGLTNNGVTNVYMVPQNKSLSSNVYLSLTGEECTLSGWQATAEHVDISAAAAYAATLTNVPSDPSNPGTGDNAPVVMLVMLLSVAGMAVTVCGKRKLF